MKSEKFQNDDVLSSSDESSEDANEYEQTLETILERRSTKKSKAKKQEIQKDTDAQTQLNKSQNGKLQPTNSATLPSSQVITSNYVTDKEQEKDEIDELNESKDNSYRGMDEEQCTQLLEKHLNNQRSESTKCDNCQKTDCVIQKADPHLFSISDKTGLSDSKTISVDGEEEHFGLIQLLCAYDKSFLVILFLCNFAQGFKQFLDLSLLNLYKDVLGLQPGEVTAYMGIIALPWSFKIFYGFSSDNIKIFGSKRRGHILLNTICCSLSMLGIMLFGVEFGKYFVTFCVLVSQYTMAYNDTVTDALTVQASKYDIPDGCEWLNGLCYMMQAIGAIFGAIMAVIVQRTPYIGPFQCFGIYLTLQSVFFICAFFMNKNMEPPEIQDLPESPRQESSNQPEDERRLLGNVDSAQESNEPQPKSCCQRLSLNFKLIWRASQNSEIYTVIAFFIIRGLLVPTFDSIQFFFLVEQAKITEDQYDLLSIAQSVGSLIGTIIYMNFLTKYQVWKLIAASLVLQLLHTWILYANVVRWTIAWGFDDIAVNIVLMLFNQAIFMTLAVLPMTVKMMYVIPKSIEASMFAICTACITFSSDWGGDIIGSALCDWLNITSTDMTLYPAAILLKMGLISIAFGFVYILPNDKKLKDLSLKLNPPEETELSSQNERGSANSETQKILFIHRPTVPN